jgi:hypothetical protein
MYLSLTEKLKVKTGLKFKNPCIFGLLGHFGRVLDTVYNLIQVVIGVFPLINIYFFVNIRAPSKLCLASIGVYTGSGGVMKAVFAIVWQNFPENLILKLFRDLFAGPGNKAV